MTSGQFTETGRRELQFNFGMMWHLQRKRGKYLIAISLVFIAMFIKDIYITVHKLSQNHTPGL